jgi:hypothetical protein
MPTSLFFNDLCMRMGMALAVWQQVEEQHYRLFLELLQVGEGDIPSVVYFSTESFDARRKMVSRMFQFSPADKPQRIEWNEIEKQLKDFNDNRNKIAHYSIRLEFTNVKKSDGRMYFKFGDYRLIPSRHNKVSVLLGRTEEDPEHNLSADAMDQYMKDFNALACRLSTFVWTMRSARLPPQSLGPQPPLPQIDPPPPLRSGA